VSGNRSIIDTFFVHKYDTTGGIKTVSITAFDDDGVSSPVLTSTITVRKAPPVLGGDKSGNPDTCWIIVDKGYTNYYYRPKYADTNGVIKRFFFGNQADTINSTTKGQVDSSILNIDENNVNKPSTRYIYVQDDDGLLRGGKFIVFADSTPPNLVIVADKKDSIITIAWSGKDVKDGNETQYAILLKAGSQPVLSDTLFSFRPGSSFSSGEEYFSDFRYDFTPNLSAQIYHYKVVAKDARGSIVISNDGTFIY